MEADGLQEDIARAAEAIKNCDALLIGAGAGMGVDSGLPDFRGSRGFWNAYPAAESLGLSFEELANPRWFETDPHLAWAFYGHRLNLYRQTTPHPGFKTLLRIGTTKPMGYFVFTSNVDGQFQKAGFSSSRIVECHGSIHHFQCMLPCSARIWAAGKQKVHVCDSTFRASHPLPRCRHCDALARPNVLMFGDGCWIGDRSEQQERRFEEWLEQIKASGAKIAAVELGAGTAIPSVRFTLERAVSHLAGILVRVNPRETAVSEGHIAIPVGAAEGIGRIAEPIGCA